MKHISFHPHFHLDQKDLEWALLVLLLLALVVVLAQCVGNLATLLQQGHLVKPVPMKCWPD